jgi:hypothetical protein
MIKMDLKALKSGLDQEDLTKSFLKFFFINKTGVDI